MRVIKPFLIRYGSYTSSIVPLSSPIAADRVSSPTGPPLNRSIIVVSIIRSVWSSPSLSTSSISSAVFAASSVIRPSYFTCAKSRTRLSIRLARRGVPRLRLASSNAPCSSICTFSTRAECWMMSFSSSTE